MVGTVLLVVSEGFHDMAFLANQVILEEAGNDVIPISNNGGAVKGDSSSVMTVRFDEALKQTQDYRAIIIAGGNHLASIEGLQEEIMKYLQEGKFVGLIGTAIALLKDTEYNLSTDDQIIESKTCISLADPEESESFAERFANLL